MPSSCQKKVLEELHTSHPGIVKTKFLARIHVLWPSVDQHIEQMVQGCASCQQCSKQTSYCTVATMVMVAQTLDENTH